MDKITIYNPFKPQVVYREDSTRTLEDPKTKLEIEVADLSQVSDGYHTIAELYDHRITNFIALCRREKVLSPEGWPHPVWRSKKHGDGNDAYEGWFIMGIGKEKGKQISYHLPLSRWDETDFAETLEQAPEWDGHTSNDVLERLKNL